MFSQPSAPSRNALVSSRSTLAQTPPAINASSSALSQAHDGVTQALQNHVAVMNSINQNPDLANSDTGKAALNASKSQLIDAINLAAIHANTPAKWAATLNVLHANGIDPAGYEDFTHGRGAILASQSGLAPQAYHPSPEDQTS